MQHPVADLDATIGSAALGRKVNFAQNDNQNHRQLSTLRGATPAARLQENTVDRVDRASI